MLQKVLLDTVEPSKYQHQGHMLCCPFYPGVSQKKQGTQCCIDIKTKTDKGEV